MTTLINLFEYLYYDLISYSKSNEIEDKIKALVKYLKRHTIFFNEMFNAEGRIKHLEGNIFTIKNHSYYVISEVALLKESTYAYVIIKVNNKLFYIKNILN